MLSTRLCIISAAAIALCNMAAAQNGEVTGTATIGAMDETFTIPFQEWDGTSPPECTSVMAGCTGELIELQHETGGTITVIDDCTFRISRYTFDGEGPAVEWWASQQAGSPAVFPYPENAIKVAELGQVGNYQTGMNVPGGSGEVVVRLGKAADGSQLLLSPDLDHISLWCEDYAVDFGNAALECDSAAPGPGPADVAPLPAPLAAAVPTDVADAPGPVDSVTPAPAPVVAAPVAADPVDGPIVVEPAMAPPAPAPAAATPEVGGPGEVQGDDDTADLGVGGDEAAEAESSEGESADGEAVEAGGAAGVAKFVSAGALAAGAAVLLL